jgi:hypothetical protein
VTRLAVASAALMAALLCEYAVVSALDEGPPTSTGEYVGVVLAAVVLLAAARLALRSGTRPPSPVVRIGFAGLALFGWLVVWIGTWALGEGGSWPFLVNGALLVAAGAGMGVSFPVLATRR